MPHDNSNTTNESREVQENSTQQQKLDLYRVLNRYPNATDDFRSDAVYKPPLRTLTNWWQKYHARHDCGHVVRYIESSTSVVHSDKYEFDLYCTRCKHRVDETDVLFIGGDWFEQHGWEFFERPLEDLRLPAHRVCELGPDPDREELEDALTITRIERNASIPPMMAWKDDELFDKFKACNECENDVPIRFDGLCRMCYDGPWTDRLMQSIHALSNAIRVNWNDSFAHRVTDKIDPEHPSSISPGSVLWRWVNTDDVAAEYPKVIVVTNSYTNDGDETLLKVLPLHDMTENIYMEATDVADVYWDTSLYCRNPESPCDNDAVAALRDRLTEDTT